MSLGESFSSKRLGPKCQSNVCAAAAQKGHPFTHFISSQSQSNWLKMWFVQSLPLQVWKTRVVRFFLFSFVHPWQAFKGNGTQQRSSCVTQDLILNQVGKQKHCVTSGFQINRPLSWNLYNCDISLVLLIVLANSIKVLYWLLSLHAVLAVYDCGQAQYVLQSMWFCSNNQTVLLHIRPKLNVKFLRRIINLPRNICWSPCCICRVLSCCREKVLIVVSCSTFDYCLHDIIHGCLAAWLYKA